MGARVGEHALQVHLNRVDPEFLETMRIPLLRGRNLTSGDASAVVVSQSLALVAWPGEDPLGKPFPMGNDDSGNPVTFTVVGVSGSARTVARRDPDAVEAYTLAALSDLPSMVVLVKTVGRPEGLVAFMGSIARGIDPGISPEVQLLTHSFQQRVQGTEHSAMAVSLLGLTALLLASLGIVGLVAYAVAQRTREIGVRMALGARASHVLSVVLLQFKHPVLGGLAVGLLGASALSQILRRQLYGVGSLDPVAYLGAIGVFVVTVTLAALLPARRALRVDPMQALRHE
jgi:hypothetical protein